MKLLNRNYVIIIGFMFEWISFFMSGFCFSFFMSGFCFFWMKFLFCFIFAINGFCLAYWVGVLIQEEAVNNYKQKQGGYTNGVQTKEERNSSS